LKPLGSGSLSRGPEDFQTSVTIRANKRKAKLKAKHNRQRARQPPKPRPTYSTSSSLKRRGLSHHRALECARFRPPQRTANGLVCLCSPRPTDVREGTSCRLHAHFPKCRYRPDPAAWSGDLCEEPVTFRDRHGDLAVALARLGRRRRGRATPENEPVK